MGKSRCQKLEAVAHAASSIRSQEKMKAWSFSYLVVQDPSPGNDAPSVRMGLPTSVTQSWLMGMSGGWSTLNKPWRCSPSLSLGDNKSCYAENINLCIIINKKICNYFLQECPGVIKWIRLSEKNKLTLYRVPNYHIFSFKKKMFICYI